MDPNTRQFDWFDGHAVFIKKQCMLHVKMTIAGINTGEGYFVALKEYAQVVTFRALTGEEISN